MDQEVATATRGRVQLVYIYLYIYLFILYIYTNMKNTETIIVASKEVGLEISVEKTKYMLLSRHQNAGQIRDIKIANMF
jgi:hypothetical protein